LYNGSVAGMVWCDKRPIYFITTKYISDDNTTVQRYDVKQQMKVSVACPAAVKAHNANISGTKKKRSVDETVPLSSPLQMAA